jgi:Ca2+-binding RTX toxin-like protein
LVITDLVNGQTITVLEVFPEAIWSSERFNKTVVFDDITLSPEDVQQRLLVSTDENDILLSNGEASVLDGGLGDDQIYGAGLDDTLTGGGGDDTILSSAGNDTLYGSDGDDTLDGGDGSDTLFGGEGNDTLYSAPYASYPHTGSPETEGDDYYDLIAPGSGDDRIYGDQYDELFVEANGGVDFYTPINGTANVTLSSDITDVRFLRFRDDVVILTGDSVDDLVRINYAYLNGGAVNVHLDATNTDITQAQEEGVYIYGGINGDFYSDEDIQGSHRTYTINDQSQSSAESARYTSIRGTDGDDWLVTGENTWDLNLRKVDARGGNRNRLYGGSGSDILRGGGLIADTLVGGGGADDIGGSWGDDTLSGQQGIDILAGSLGTNLYLIDRDNIRYDIDVIDLGFNYEGNDVVKFEHLSSADVVLLRNSDDDLFIIDPATRQAVIVVRYYYETDDIAAIEFSDQTLTLSEINARVSLDAAAGNITDGFDVDIKSISYADYRARDVIDSISNQSLSGTSANDTIFAIGTDLTANAFEGNDTIFAIAGDDSIFEYTLTVRNSDYNDPTQHGMQFFGGAGHDVLWGSVFDDHLYGDDIAGVESGDDVLHGLEGNDVLVGGIGNDTLYGDEGADTLTGGAGNDYLFGGDSDGDQFVFNVGDGQDTILDEGGNDDRLIFGAGITPEGLRRQLVSVSGESYQNLVLLVDGTDDSITIDRWSDGDAYQLEFFEFQESGETLSVVEFFDRVPTVSGNEAPNAVADSFNASEDQPLTVTFSELLNNDTDAEDDTLAIVSVSNPVNGTVDIDVGNQTITFNPAPNYNGPASFDYTISDGTSTSTANVSVAVDSVNDLPSADDDTVTAIEDLPRVIAFSELLGNDTDDDGDTLDIESVDNAVNGTATIDIGNQTITFTPADGYSGPASFDYTINDGTTTSSATVTVNVSTANDAPVANADAVTASEDQPLVINFSELLGNDTDPENDSLTIESVSNSVNGTVAIDTGAQTITFTPAADYHGAASFDYTINDGTSTSSATVSVDVTAANDTPVADNDSLSVVEDQSLVIDFADLLLNDSDVDGDSLTIDSVSSPVNATVSIDTSAQTITFTPTSDYTGPASFDYTISDGTSSSTATVSVDVTTANDAPVAAADTLSAVEDQNRVITFAELLGNDSDIDGDSLTIESVSSPVNATVSIDTQAETITFTPSANYNGPASFDYTINDGTTTSSATVIVNVSAANDAPVANADAVTASEDQPLVINFSELLGNDTDPENDSLTIESVSNSVNGTVAIDTGAQTITFTPAADYHGAASFDYTVNDGTSTSSATVAVTVGAVNDTPVATGDSLSANENQPEVITFAELLANDSDVDGDSLSVVSVSGAVNGSVSIDTGAQTITFTPTTDFNGAASFEYELSDGTESVTATVSVTVAPSTPGNVYNGTAGDDDYTGTSDVDILYGNAGNDTLSGGSGNDSLYGGDGTDTLYGSKGNDVLDGGAGDDFLSAYTGNDTFVFGLGSGNDTIDQYDGDAGRHDVILLGSGITESDVTLSRPADGLYVTLNATGESLLMNSFFKNDGDSAWSLDEIRFDDGASWDVDTIKAKVLEATTGKDVLVGYATADSISGDDGNDTLYGHEGNDTLLGDAGEDKLIGDEGNDTLYGGTELDRLYGGDDDDALFGEDGADYLYGDAGADTLVGGVGNDRLTGGEGDDTYVFSQTSSEGDDIIYNDASTWATDNDVLELTASTKESLWFSQEGADLRVDFVGNNGSLLIDDWYTSANFEVDEIHAGEETLYAADVQQLVDAMAAFTDTSGIIGDGGSAPVGDTDFNNVLAAAWQPVA